MRARYLIVDGHSAIFGWPELQRFHARRTSLGRDALVKKLRDYQDYTGIRVVVVFDGKGNSATEQTEPHSVQVFYSRAGQTADSIIERLASKYAEKFDLIVATGLNVFRSRPCEQCLTKQCRIRLRQAILFAGARGAHCSGFLPALAQAHNRVVPWANSYLHSRSRRRALPRGLAPHCNLFQ